MANASETIKSATKSSTAAADGATCRTRSGARTSVSAGAPGAAPMHPTRTHHTADAHLRGRAAAAAARKACTRGTTQTLLARPTRHPTFRFGPTRCIAYATAHIANNAGPTPPATA